MRILGFRVLGFKVRCLDHVILDKAGGGLGVMRPPGPGMFSDPTRIRIKDLLRAN